MALHTFLASNGSKTLFASELGLESPQPLSRQSSKHKEGHMDQHYTGRTIQTLGHTQKNL